MTTEDVIAIRVPTPFAVGDVIVYLVKGDALTLIDAGRIQKRLPEPYKSSLPL